MNRFGKLTIEEAIRIVDSYDSMSPNQFGDVVLYKWQQGIIDTSELTEYDTEVRKELKEVFDSFYEEAKKDRRQFYSLDLAMGIKIFSLLNPYETEFSLSDASDDDVWRYITIRIIPDLTYLRYPPRHEKGAKNINKKRFFSEKRRIWIKSLWWYIYLSWQGDYKTTYDVLKDNATDNINKLIETPGRGYRLSLYRAIMREYAKREHKTGYFAGVTKLNNAKCKTIEPSLMEMGEEVYVKELFDKVPITVEAEEDDD